MSTHKLSNVSLDDYREFLSKAGCKKIGTEGGMKNGAEKIYYGLLLCRHILIRYLNLL